MYTLIIMLGNYNNNTMVYIYKIQVLTIFWKPHYDCAIIQLRYMQIIEACAIYRKDSIIQEHTAENREK